MNKTKYLLIALVAAFSLVLMGGRSFAQNNDWVEGTVQGYYHPNSWDTFNASWLIGQRVYSPTGGDLGQISNLLVDRANGRIALVILADVPGFGTEYVAAPFSALERTGEDIFHLSFGGRDAGVSSIYEPMNRYASELDRHVNTVGLSRIPSKIDPIWAENVYRFYGQTPYWAEGKMPNPNIEGQMSYYIMSDRVAENAASMAGFSGEKIAPALIGAMVRSIDGKASVRIDDLVIDSKDGHLVFAIVDQVPGRGNAQVAVPYEEVAMGRSGLVLNTTEQKLAAASTFNESADSNNFKKAEDIYRFFGEQPYWTEGGHMSGSMMEHSTSASTPFKRPVGLAPRWAHLVQ